jgi:hypothetical protein
MHNPESILVFVGQTDQTDSGSPLRGVRNDDKVVPTLVERGSRSA